MTHLIQHPIENIENHPEAGASLTVGHVLLALLIKFIDNGHVNPLIMDLLQIGAWCVAMVVGVFTIIGYSKKWSESDKKKQDAKFKHSENEHKRK